MRLEGDDWTRVWNGARRRAWRLEVHQVYTMPHEAEMFAKWKRGEGVPLVEDWQNSIRERIQAGTYIGRVHLVRPPLSDYLRFEFEAYQMSFAVGDDIRILDLSTMENPGLPDEDFWLLDDQVVRMLYRPDGTQIGRELVEDQSQLPTFERYMKLAIENSVPLNEYEH